MAKRERIEWQDIWVTGAEDETQPKLLMVGDSITRSYFAPVEAALNGALLCARLTTSTCVGDPALERQLALLLDDYRFAVIHFNNGLHGWDYDEAEYQAGLAHTLAFLRQRSPASKLIWATSTPMRQRDHLAVFDARTERVRERNRLARALAEQHRLPIDDLYSVVIDHPEYYSADGVHFNADGQAALAQQVARSVRAPA